MNRLCAVSVIVYGSALRWIARTLTNGWGKWGEGVITTTTTTAAAVATTAIELSLGSSSPYTSTDETRINIHKRNNTNHSTYNK